jgi:hypothetical protein
MTELLEQAIAKVKQLSESEQNEVAKMILQKIDSEKKLTSLWDKIDELGEDPEKLSMNEITEMVKKDRHKII